MMTMAPFLTWTEDWIVVTFDFYASETLLKDLETAKKLDHLVDFLNEVHDAMVAFKYVQYRGTRTIQPIHFERYKFTGDGWILLFPPTTPGSDILLVVERITHTFWNRFVNRIQELLKKAPDQAGIRFGIDQGTLQRVKWDGKVEYVGPALMLAQRLQNALKPEAQKKRPRKINKGKNPFKSWAEILVRKRCYQSIFKPPVNGVRYWAPHSTKVSLDKVRKSKKTACVKLGMIPIWTRFLRNFQHDPDDFAP